MAERTYLFRMTRLKRLMGADIRKERERLGMTGEAFGEYLSGLIGSDRAYTRAEVSGWETDLRPFPARLELALVRQKLEACEKEVRKAKRA